MGKVYTINGKRYTVDEVSYVAGEEQVFKVNGQKVKLSVQEGFGNERFIGLSMPGASRDKANELLPAVYGVMEKRIADGSAHKLEQAAMLQLHYNEALRAEGISKGLSGDNVIVHSVVTKDDLSAKKEKIKLNMDISKRFPWLRNKDSKEYKALMQVLKYRKIEYFPDGSMYDSLAQELKKQRDIFDKFPTKVYVYSGLDDRTVPAAEERAKNPRPDAGNLVMLQKLAEGRT